LRLGVKGEVPKRVEEGRAFGSFDVVQGDGEVEAAPGGNIRGKVAGVGEDFGRGGGLGIEKAVGEPFKLDGGVAVGVELGEQQPGAPAAQGAGVGGVGEQGAEGADDSKR